MSQRASGGSEKGLRIPQALSRVWRQMVIATALVIIAPVMVAVAFPGAMEIPVIGMIVEHNARLVDAALRMPAIAFTIADDVGGSADTRSCQAANGQ